MNYNTINQLPMVFYIILNFYIISYHIIYMKFESYYINYKDLKYKKSIIVKLIDHNYDDSHPIKSELSSYLTTKYHKYISKVN